jgi:hypothetical protein
MAFDSGARSRGRCVAGYRGLWKEIRPLRPGFVVLCASRLLGRQVEMRGLARETLHRIRELARERPLVYLPSHDPEAAIRLDAWQIVGRMTGDG